MFLFFLLALTFLPIYCIESQCKYEILYYQQRQDHFNHQNSQYFSQRVVICSEYFDQSKSSPIFVYTGNENDIFFFYNNTGLPFEFAKSFNALVVFIEHRYYGESIPDAKLDYLSVDQALADFVDIITHLKYEKLEMYPNSSVIVFGGSYGGILSSYMRLRYSHIIDGALASSAPSLHFEGLVDPDEVMKIVTDNFRNIGSGICSDIVRKGIFWIDYYRTKEDYPLLRKYFPTCQLLSQSSEVDLLLGLLETALMGMSMTNYPTPATFFTNLPAWPVQFTCKMIIDRISNDTHSFLEAMSDIINVYYNYTGDKSCYDLNWKLIRGISWNYQLCTELIFPVGKNGETDFFLPQPWIYSNYEKSCQTIFHNNLNPAPNWLPTSFYGKVLKPPISKMIFSNGIYDPWRSGSVLKENIESDSIYSIIIKDGAHHSDLRFTSKEDPQSLIEARNLEQKIIAKWIQDKFNHS